MSDQKVQDQKVLVHCVTIQDIMMVFKNNPETAVVPKQLYFVDLGTFVLTLGPPFYSALGFPSCPLCHHLRPSRICLIFF